MTIADDSERDARFDLLMGLRDDEDIADLPFLSSFLRGVLATGDPEAAAAVVAVGVLGTARLAAGKGLPGKAWGNVCYRELATFLPRVERLAATEERCER